MWSEMESFSLVGTTLAVKMTFVEAIKTDEEGTDGYRIGDYVYYRREKIVTMTIDEFCAAMKSRELYLCDGVRHLQYDIKRQLPVPKKFKLIRNKWLW